MEIANKLENDILDLSFSDLQNVPVEEIAKIKKASYLDLSNNQINYLPETIVTLRNIVVLDLSKNMLTEIPENIGEMRQLQRLDLYSNKISRLPLSMGDLKNLKWLDLKNNPLTPAVASVAGACSNISECQICARNVVAYLTNVKRNLEEERTRRKNMLITLEKDKNSNQKKMKKKKKKSADKESDGECVTSEPDIPSVDAMDSTKLLGEEQVDDSKNGELSNIFNAVVYLTVMILIIGIWIIYYYIINEI